MENTRKTPLIELKQEDLIHYEEISLKANHCRNSIPRAINFYYEYKQMSFLNRIIQAFK